MAACTSCGTPVRRAGQRFCDECGTALAHEVAPAATESSSRQASSRQASSRQAPTVSERRVCSVLFVDLVGFTPLSESKDPEEVRELLSEYFDRAKTIIGRYGGVVEKFIGDAVMAIWGTPVATEEDAERAVRAALEVVAAVQLLGEKVGATGLAARAGVVTGEVAVTSGLGGEGVAGDTVNTASRVQSVADPGSVWVDEATERLARASIGFTDVGEHVLKGKTDPLRLLCATRVLSAVGGRQGSDALEAPFTARDAELRSLKDLFHTAIERRSPRLVVVSGPAGVGKSRLGWEFEKYVDGIADTVLWHRGRCLSYGEGIVFWALAEIVRQRFGIAEEDHVDVASAKLTEGLVRFVVDPAERDYVGVRLSRLLGVPYPSESKVVLTKEELYAGWRLFFERLAQVAPLVILIEDAQHADDSLLGFFSHLIDWTRDLPIFVLLFARPGLEAIDSGYGVGRNRSTLSLDALDDASMAGLVESLVPAMPASARDAIAARAQGIALFAVETVRSLIDRGILQREGDGYRLVQDLGDLLVPDSLHSLLAARLDALPQEVRTLVANASVLGSSFPKEALIAISDAGEEAVLRALDELVRRDVLQVFADPLSPERGAYRFGQEMLRQVAYDTLSKKDRKSRHLAVAAYLRSTFANDGDEIGDIIARHYLDALAASPSDDESEEVAALALEYLIRAGEHAERSGALSRAAESYSQAAGIAPPIRVAALYERASRVLYHFGDFDESVKWADAARDQYLALGDQRAVARARSMKGGSLVRAGRHVAARNELADALEILRPEPDADTVEALRHLGTLEAFSGNLVEAEQLIAEGLVLGQAIAVGPYEMAQLFIMRGITAIFANRMFEAVASLEMGAKIAEQAGELGVLSRAQVNLADALSRTDPVSALEPARSAAAHARRTGQLDSLAYAVSNLAVALMEIGEWDEAEAGLTEVLEIEVVDAEIAYFIDGWLGGLCGDGDRVLRALESTEMRRANEEAQAQAGVALLEAINATCFGDLGASLTHGLRALEKRDAVGIAAESLRWAWPLSARAARQLGDTQTLGVLLSMLEDYPVGHLPPSLRAERQLVKALMRADSAGADAGAAVDGEVREAVSAVRDVGNPYELAHALIDWADLCVRFETEDPEPALSEARGIAEKLRCPPLIERIDSVSRSTVSTG